MRGGVLHAAPSFSGRRPARTWTEESSGRSSPRNWRRAVEWVDSRNDPAKLHDPSPISSPRMAEVKDPLKRLDYIDCLGTTREVRGPASRLRGDHRKVEKSRDLNGARCISVGCRQ
jgi:hypothetical protein